MARWLYAVYFIITLGCVKIGFDLYQSATKIAADFAECQKLEGAEKSKCEKNVEDRSNKLSTIILALTGRH